MNFLNIPYLPQSKLRLAVGNCENAAFEVIKPYCAQRLAPSMRLHADLTFCYLGQKTAVCAPESYEYYAEKLAALPLRLVAGETSLDRHYPRDAAYNVAIVGGRLFCKVSICDKKLLSEAERCGYEIININQGYAKCSVCPVAPNAAISADVSFFRAATAVGIDVLLITNDTVVLDGFPNGFFGGAAYMEDKNTLKCFGDLSLHPDFEKIGGFLSRYRVKYQPSQKGELRDIGSLCPIMCE